MSNEGLICPKKCHKCCTTWFSGVHLTEYEYKKLIEYGARHLGLTEDGGPILNFVGGKCEFLSEGKCTIYDKDFRPRICKSFYCSNRTKKIRKS